jgi:hypothetical protein
MKMGYSTYFSGGLELTPPANKELTSFVNEWKNTRRMARDVSKLTDKSKGLNGEFGVEGEFYIGSGEYGQDSDDSVINYNKPPKTQPSLWCQWELSQDGTILEWDEGEKFYEYIEWLEYMIDKFFEPSGIKLNGEIHWNGQESDDRGIIKVINNQVKIGVAKYTYEFE